MVRAGKGDSYIVSDKDGDNEWKRMLIDGGAGGTWPRILLAMTSLGMTLTSRFDAVVVTHYDNDHINGILRMLRSQPRPEIALCTFNSPDAPTTVAAMTRKEAAEYIRGAKLIDEMDASERPPFYSPGQGRLLSATLLADHITTSAPTGSPPATSGPGDNTLGVLDRMATRICGPTAANVGEMHADNWDPEAINRSSTILTMASKDTDAAGQPVNSDGLSFLFPGDGHDTLPDENDIRGGATLLTPLQTDHFSVMKVPHHGSRRSEDRAFYLAYTADLYLISSHYRSHALPSFETIQAICDSRHAPVIVTTSRWQQSGIQDLVTQVRPLLQAVGGVMWIYDDATDLLVSSPLHSPRLRSPPLLCAYLYIVQHVVLMLTICLSAW